MHENDDYSYEPELFGKVAGLFCACMVIATVVAAICISL